MQDLMTREPSIATPTATNDDEPGFVDCRGRWQSLATPTEAD